MPTYSALEAVRDVEGLYGERPLRLYRTRFSSDPLEYRYHFGFPKAMFVPPLLTLFEARWGEHWREEGGFYVWAVPVISPEPEPTARLRKHFQAMFRGYKAAIKAGQRIASA